MRGARSGSRCSSRLASGCLVSSRSRGYFWQASASGRVSPACGVDLYAWIAAIERYLSGERDALPTLGHQSCRLSTWLNAEGHACDSGQPSFQRIEALHWELHTLAERLVDLKV